MALLSALFLGCFVFGFAAVTLSFLLGAVHGTGVGGHHLELPGGHHLDLLGGHHHIELTGHAHALHGGAAGAASVQVGGPGGHVGAHTGHVAHAETAHAGAHGGDFDLSAFVNPTSVLTFLTWFGGVGFILHNYYHAVAVLSLAVAAGAGLVGAAVVIWFMLKILLPQQTVMYQADYDPVGSVGRLSVPIRAGGVGEVVYHRGGTRRSAGARSLDGQALQRGAEVVIAKYERGVAYVQPWEQFVGQERPAEAAEARG